MENKRVDILEKLFLLSVIIDMSVISLISIFIVTIITICVFFSVLMFGIEAVVLLCEAVKLIFNLQIFAGIGFIGASLSYGIATFAFSVAFHKLIKSYPKILHGLKNFITSKDEQEQDNITTIEKEKHVVHVMIVTIVISLIMIFIAIFTNNFNMITDFIQENFNFETIGNVFQRGING